MMRFIDWVCILFSSVFIVFSVVCFAFPDSYFKSSFYPLKGQFIGLEKTSYNKRFLFYTSRNHPRLIMYKQHRLYWTEEEIEKKINRNENSAADTLLEQKLINDSLLFLRLQVIDGGQTYKGHLLTRGNKIFVYRTYVSGGMPTWLKTHLDYTINISGLRDYEIILGLPY